MDYHVKVNLDWAKNLERAAGRLNPFCRDLCSSSWPNGQGGEQAEVTHLGGPSAGPAKACKSRPMFS